MKKQKILELRKKLDRALDVPDLSNDELIKSLVKKQLLSSSESLVEGGIEQLVVKRTKEVSNFLEMLRSASGNEGNGKLHKTSHIDWKVKQDTDQLRVMYCEGPHGSPFHNLLAEGCADGPIDVCLCVSWESFLYSKWWPQYNIPTFKIILSTCLQKVRVGEEISLMRLVANFLTRPRCPLLFLLYLSYLFLYFDYLKERMKVPWPISDREALLHYFAIEYLEEDLILVLIKTISDTEPIDVNVDGFSRNTIPEAKDTVRVDLVGGFVIQKVDHNKCYFRVIANMDIKLDFVPPSLINFISRQLIGNGHKLFQKAVSTVATSDEDYRKALQKPMYARIREGIVNTNKKKKMIVSVLHEEKPTDPSPKEHEYETEAINMSVTNDRFVSEITEEDTENKHSGSGFPYSITTHHQEPIRKTSDISPEVQRALGILDNCITIIRGYSPDEKKCSANEVESSAFGAKPMLNVNTDEVEHGLGNHDDEPQETPEAKSPDRSSSSSSTKSSVASEERPRVLGPLAPDRRTHSHFELTQNGGTTGKPFLVESMNKVCDEVSIKANGFHEKDSSKRRGRKRWICCFSQNRAKDKQQF